MDYEKGVPRNLVQFSEYSDLAFTDTGVRIDDQSDPNPNVLWSSEKISQLVNTVPRISVPQSRAIIPSLNHMQSTLNNAILPTMNQIQNPFTHTVKQRRQRPTNSFGEHHPHIPRIFKPKWWFSRLMHSRNHYCERCINYKDHFFTSKYKDNSYLKCSCDGCTNKKCKQHGMVPQHIQGNPMAPAPPMAMPPMQAPMLSSLNFPQLRLPTITIGPPGMGNVSPNSPNSPIVN